MVGNVGADAFSFFHASSRVAAALVKSLDRNNVLVDSCELYHLSRQGWLVFDVWCIPRLYYLLNDVEQLELSR